MRKAFEWFLILCFFLVGCFSVGGQSTAVKPETVAKLKTALRTTQEQIDKSKQEIKNVKGDVQTFRTDITKIQNTQNNLQMQLTTIETNNVQNNEVWPYVAIIGGMMLLFFFYLYMDKGYHRFGRKK
jgi:peptidoglycan hydrolase CwlO-like protein